jgi:hypothetical protein
VDAIRGGYDPRPTGGDWFDAGVGVLLFGSEAARDATRRVIAEIGELMDDAKARGGGGNVVKADALHEAWEARSGAINAAKSVSSACSRVAYRSTASSSLASASP